MLACRKANVKYANLSEMLPDGLTAAERAVFRRLNTLEKIQRFLDVELAYNKEPDGPTCRSPRRVLRDRTAHCMEGALFAAAAARESEVRSALRNWTGHSRRFNRSRARY